MCQWNWVFSQLKNWTYLCILNVNLSFILRMLSVKMMTIFIFTSNTTSIVIGLIIWKVLSTDDDGKLLIIIHLSLFYFIICLLEPDCSLEYPSNNPGSWKRINELHSNFHRIVTALLLDTVSVSLVTTVLQLTCKWVWYYLLVAVYQVSYE